VYLRNVDVLMGYFAHRCRDPQTVADLTSETFVRAVDGFARYGSEGGGDGGLPTVRSQPSAGAIRAEHADLGDGDTSATVRMRRPGVAVLSASYDPGWTATVNGRRQPTRMVAPALVAVDVPRAQTTSCSASAGTATTRSCSR
jgi:hypothetical protein